MPATPTFHYSDGDDHEAYLRDVIVATHDRSLFAPSLAEAVRDWPSLYHLSSMRANLLRPITIDSSWRVLEVGSGMGAVTRYLGELGCHVTAVEGSHRRAAITAARTAGLNVEVHCCNFLEFTSEQKFDLVVAVGVLEYAGQYSSARDPHLEFLEHCASLVNSNGFVVVASENRLGLKYLMGVREDHLGIPYVGIEANYPIGGPATFSRRELEQLADRAGFADRRVLAPFPDYKLPKCLIDFERAPSAAAATLAQLAASSLAVDHQIERPTDVSIELATVSVVEDGLGAELAPSHLLIATPDGVVDNAVDSSTYAWAYATNRADSFRKETRLLMEDGHHVARRYLLGPGDTHPEHAQPDLHQVLLTEPVYGGESSWVALVRAINRDSWTAETLSDAIRPWADLLKEMSQAQMLDGRYLDATPFNSLQSNGKSTLIDQEWVWSQPIPTSWVMMRGLVFSLDGLTSVAPAGMGPPATVWEVSAQILSSLNVEPPTVDGGFLDWLCDVQSEASGQSTEAVCDKLKALFATKLPYRESRRSVSATSRIRI